MGKIFFKGLQENFKARGFFSYPEKYNPKNQTRLRRTQITITYFALFRISGFISYLCDLCHDWE